MNYYPILFSQSGGAINLLTLLFSSSGRLRQNIHVLKNVKAIDCAGRRCCAQKGRGCGGRSKRVFWHTLCDVGAKGTKGPEFFQRLEKLVISRAPQQLFVVKPQPVPMVLKREHCKIRRMKVCLLMGNINFRMCCVALSSLPAAECFLSTVMYLGRKCQLNADKPIGATFQEAGIETVVNVA